MNPVIALARAYVPNVLRSRGLEYVCTLTEQALERTMEPGPGKTFEERLEMYARFTEDAATELSEDRSKFTRAQMRLRSNASTLGLRLRRVFSVSTRKDVVDTAQVLYKMLGMDFEGTTDGTIVVRKCSFARLYSPTTCKLMSSFDEGVLAGLNGCGALQFSERLSEGSSCCRAVFNFEGTVHEAGNRSR